MIDNSNIDYPLQIAVFALLILKNIHSTNCCLLHTKAASYVLYNTQYMNTYEPWCLKFRRKTFFQATGTRVVLFVTRTISLPKQRELLCLSELRLEFDSKEIMKLTREGKESGRNFVAKTSSTCRHA